MSFKGGFLLKQSDQQRINLIISKFAKTQPNLLKFSQVMMLLLDRCILSNKLSLGQFYKIFQSAQNMQNIKVSDKDTIQGQRILGRQQLIYLFNQIAKIIFKSDQSYQQRFYNSFLSQQISADNNQINHARVMVFDQINKKLLLEDCIKTISKYQQQLKHIFVSYLIQNYWSQKRSKRLLLNLRQIFLQNKKWVFTSLIFFLKQSQTTPHLINIQQIQQSLRLIIPNTNNKQQQFYSRHVLSDTYHKQLQNHDDTMHAGDPGLSFYQFQLMILRIAYDSYPKQLQKKNLEDIVQRYCKYLALRSNQSMGQQLPNLSKKMLIKMKQYYLIQANYSYSRDLKITEEKQKNDPVKILAQKINQQIINANNINFDYKQAIKTLDRDLPKLPPLPELVKQCPNPSKDDYVTIGQQPPPEPVDKNQKQAKPQKKDAGKKDEIPPRQFKWANMPQIKISAQDYFKQVQTKLNYQVKPLTDIQRGTIKKSSYPILIGQILFPPQLPKSVTDYLISASNALSDRNFILALQNYSKGLQQWKKTNVQIDSPIQLFFQYSRGNIYLSAGKLQNAFQIFYNLKKYADTSRLPFSNPDRSLPSYGMGQVLYQMEEYQLAARSFLKSREIRQSVLGLEHVQTASVFNNLACCFFMLGRSHEALGYIQIAEVVMDTELGPHHERTMTCRSNLKKIESGTFNNIPQYRKMWQVFEQDKFEKKKKKKKQKDSKKK